MTHDHQHRHGADSGGRNLLVALLLNVGITVAQVVGGLLSGSLSLIADAAHNASDAASLGISLGARRVAQRKADEERTFGYRRAEVVGALINLTTLFAIGLYLLWEAGARFVAPSAVDGTVMIVVGLIAFVEDAVSVWLLWGGRRDSINIRSAFIHLMGDTLATLGVVAGGFLIVTAELYWIDPAITAAIAVYIFVHGWIEIRRAVRLLIDSAPEGFEFERMVHEVEAVDGVVDMHHVHIWHLDEHRIALEAHLAVAERDLGSIEEIKRRVKRLLREEFQIVHTTLEIEIEGRVEHNRSLIHRGE